MPLAFDDERKACTHGAPDPEQINFDDALERDFLHVQHGGGRIACDAGVCEHHVDPPEPRHGFVDDLIELVPLSDAGDPRQRACIAQLASQGVDAAGRHID